MSDRYTLAEARHLIAIEDCGREGHHPSIEYKFGSPDPYTLICSRCGQIWHVATREEVLRRQNPTEAQPKIEAPRKKPGSARDAPGTTPRRRLDA